jgi:Carboxypeptidase regulatory-like domain
MKHAILVFGAVAFRKERIMVRGMGTCLRAFVILITTTLGFFALGACLVFAQGSTATISGVVRDTTGALVPGVTINVKNMESGFMRGAVSNESGGYNLQLLPVGPYELTTDMPGFKQQVRRGINLSVTQEAIVNLTLEVGSVAERITVVEEAPLVNTTLSSTSGLFPRPF